jgi:hypothetical protein
MRTARSRNGLNLEGNVIIPYRSPLSVREGGDTNLSFQGWHESAPLPEFQDHVTGHKLMNPPPIKSKTTLAPSVDHPYEYPNNPIFGPSSVVRVPCPPKLKPPDSVGRSTEDMEGLLNPAANLDPESTENLMTGEISENQYLTAIDRNVEDAADSTPTTQRPQRNVQGDALIRNDEKSIPAQGKERRPVNQRWYYEPVLTADAFDFQAEELPVEADSQMDLGKLVENEIDEPTFRPPGILGEVSLVTQDQLEAVPDDENGARYLQGLLFNDSELDWCRISGWGVENGVIMVHYSPIASDDPVEEEQHSSLAELLSWIKQSSHPVATPKLEPSRALRRSNRIRKHLCYRQMDGLPFQDVPIVGTYVSLDASSRLGSYDGKPLTNKVIRRILRAQETIFKYGTMIPRNDAEANRSPEAVRWMSGR